MQSAVIYARISQDRTGAGLGVDRQLVECRQYAQERGLEVTGELTDNDVSAYSGKRRPGYQQLLTRVRDGKVDVVLVWHTDRLHRSPKELEEYIDATSIHKVQTWTVKAGELDLTTSTGRLIARQLGSLARYESEHRGERMSAKRRQAALAGSWQGGPRPFGWDILRETDKQGRRTWRMVILEEEAELVRWAFQAVLEGKSISGIVAHFERSGVPSVRGNGWRHSTVRSLMGKTRNCGIESLHGEEMGPSAFPALVDEGTFRAVQRILQNPARKTQDDNRTKHLLGGIARCHCGELMVAGKSSQKNPKLIYVCNSARFTATRRRDISHVTRSMKEMDEYVEKAWSRVMYNPNNALRLHAPAAEEDVRALETELAAARTKQDDLLDMWSKDEITARQFASMNPKLTDRIEELEKQLAHLAEQGQILPDLLPNQVEAYWQTLDVLERREVLKQSVEIVCFPTGGKPFAKLENKWDYVQITARPATDSHQRIIYWKPTVEPAYDEGDPASVGLPADASAPWPPA